MGGTMDLQIVRIGHRMNKDAPIMLVAAIVVEQTRHDCFLVLSHLSVFLRIRRVCGQIFCANVSADSGEELAYNLRAVVCENIFRYVMKHNPTPEENGCHVGGCCACSVESSCVSGKPVGNSHDILVFFWHLRQWFRDAHCIKSQSPRRRKQLDEAYKSKHFPIHCTTVPIAHCVVHILCNALPAMIPAHGAIHVSSMRMASWGRVRWKIP